MHKAIEVEFGGTLVAFRLETGAAWAAAIELHLGPPFALMARMSAGSWSIEDLRRILSLAYAGAPNRHLALVPEVDAELAGAAPGRYAPLAVEILRGYLFGDEEAAAESGAAAAAS